MAHVQRANVFLTVPDDEIQRYIDKGYNVVDEYGNIIKQALPNNVGDLQILVVKYEKRIKELEDYIASLEIIEDLPEEEEEEPEVSKPRRKKTAK